MDVYFLVGQKKMCVLRIIHILMNNEKTNSSIIKVDMCILQ